MFDLRIWEESSEARKCDFQHAGMAEKVIARNTGPAFPFTLSKKSKNIHCFLGQSCPVYLVE